MHKRMTWFYNMNKANLNVFCEVGVHDWRACRLHRPLQDGKTVILVEPLPDCFNDLKAHVNANPNVTLHNCAIADFDGETTIYNEGQSAFIEAVRGQAPCHQNGYFDVVGARQAQPHEIVTVRTSLFSHIDPGNIDVLLIDTEGCEYFVLKHLLSVPAVIAVETHGFKYKNPYAQEIVRWMSDHKYRLWFKSEADTYYINQFVIENAIGEIPQYLKGS